LIITPVGTVPDSANVGAGYPLALTATLPPVPVTKLAASGVGLVITGADGAGVTVTMAALLVTEVAPALLTVT
jgi:hypothetical protein